MAITPKTLIKSPTILLGVSLSIIALGATVNWLGSSACQMDTYEEYEVASDSYLMIDGDCGHLLNPNTTQYSEHDYINVAFCYEDLGRNELAMDVATLGLGNYPQSESLNNILGYHLIEFGQYEEAVDTLSSALKTVTLTNGIMENNLAWATLWAQREMPLEHSRALYQSALRRNTSGINCEAVHTGMWVEYAIAARTGANQREAALRNFQSLRDQYDGCEQRSGDSVKLIEEIAGAAVLDVEVARLNSQDTRPAWAMKHSGIALARQASSALRAENLSAAEVCAAATPIEATHHTCMQLMNASRCRK
jgi:tetratricopeptide (TPR) repeat protein